MGTNTYRPKCGSGSVAVISGASKVATVAMRGVLAASKVRSTYKCKDCDRKF